MIVALKSHSERYGPPVLMSLREKGNMTGTAIVVITARPSYQETTTTKELRFSYRPCHLLVQVFDTICKVQSLYKHRCQFLHKPDNGSPRDANLHVSTMAEGRTLPLTTNGKYEVTLRGLPALRKAQSIRSWTRRNRKGTRFAKSPFEPCQKHL